MKRNISQRYASLLSRRLPAEARLFVKFAEAFEIEQGEFTKYLLGACKPVKKSYTDKLLEQGDRVENQLQKKISCFYPSIEFERQGSVSNSTHIKFYSDIDILTIIDKFITLEHPQTATFPYQGVPTDDLLTLRTCCNSALSSAFPTANVDSSGSTSLAISGGSLACKVDVVPSNWFNSNLFRQTSLAHLRGVMVLNKENMTRKTNFPFLFNYRLSEKDELNGGIPKMFIRLLKTIKCDAEEEGEDIDFSSFDIASIIFCMPNQFFRDSIMRPLSLIKNLVNWLNYIINNDAFRVKMLVVDDSRFIFDKPAKFSSFKTLFQEFLIVYRGALEEQPDTYVSESLVA